MKLPYVVFNLWIPFLKHLKGSRIIIVHFNGALSIASKAPWSMYGYPDKIGLQLALELAKKLLTAVQNLSVLLGILNQHGNRK